MLNKIINYILVTLVLSLGFGQLLRFQLFSIPIYLHDLLVICILLLKGLTCDWRSVLAIKRTFLNRRPEQSSSRDTKGGRRVLMDTTAIYIFLLSFLLSSVYALTLYPLSSLLIPSLYLLRLLAYLALYFSLTRSKIIIPLQYFYTSAAISLGIGLLQYFLMPDMRWGQYLGWDDHLSRLTLPHFDPTFSAVMFSLALFITPLKYWYLSILLSFGILLTYSRSVWLALFFTGICFIRNKSILLLSIILLVVSIFALPQKFGEGTNLLRTYSISSRFDADISYFQKYKWDLLIGRGMNTHILDSTPSLYDNHATGPNNSYLYLISTAGILGLIGWGIFMFTLYQRSLYKPMLFFFFAASLFNNVMFYPFTLLWVLLIHCTTQKNI